MYSIPYNLSEDSRQGRLERQDSWSSDIVMLGSTVDKDFDFVTIADNPFHRDLGSFTSGSTGSDDIIATKDKPLCRVVSQEDDYDNDDDDVYGQEEPSFVNPRTAFQAFAAFDDDDDDEFDFSHLMTMNDETTSNDIHNGFEPVEDIQQPTAEEKPEDHGAHSNRVSPIARLRMREASLFDQESSYEQSPSSHQSPATHSPYKLRRSPNVPSPASSYRSPLRYNRYPISPPPPPPPGPPPNQRRSTSFANRYSHVTLRAKAIRNRRARFQEEEKVEVEEAEEETPPALSPTSAIEDTTEEDVEKVFQSYISMIQERVSIDIIEQKLLQDSSILGRDAKIFLLGIRAQLSINHQQSPANRVSEEEKTEEQEGEKAPLSKDTNASSEEKKEDDSDSPAVDDSKSEQKSKSTVPITASALRTHASRKTSLFDQKLSMMMSMMKDSQSLSLSSHDPLHDDARTSVSVMSTMSCRELSIQRLQRRLASRIQKQQRKEKETEPEAQQPEAEKISSDASCATATTAASTTAQSIEAPKASTTTASNESAIERVQKLLKDLQEAQSRQKRLEQQLNKAGISIAEDIPYAVAKEQVARIAQQMQDIGDSQAKHPDPKVQAQMRQDYFILEQQMEKYTRALELTDEFLMEQEQMERSWDEENAKDNEMALTQLLKHMPVNIRKKSINDWLQIRTPSGHYLPKPFLLKFSRTNVLTLVRMDPELVKRAHPSNLENRRVTGLTLTERRALQAYLQPIATQAWKNGKDPLTKRKWNWYCVMRLNFKEYLRSYQRHVEEYGVDLENINDDSDDGAAAKKDVCTCRFSGKCPIRANQKLNYFEQDFGYPCDLNQPLYEDMACHYQDQPSKSPSSDDKTNAETTSSTERKNEMSNPSAPPSSMNMKTKVKQRIERNGRQRDPLRGSLMDQIASRGGAGKKPAVAPGPANPRAGLMAAIASRASKS